MYGFDFDPTNPMGIHGDGPETIEREIIKTSDERCPVKMGRGTYPIFAGGKDLPTAWAELKFEPSINPSGNTAGYIGHGVEAEMRLRRACVEMAAAMYWISNAGLTEKLNEAVPHSSVRLSTSSKRLTLIGNSRPISDVEALSLGQALLASSVAVGYTTNIPLQAIPVLVAE